MTFTTEWTRKRERKAARARKLLEKQRAIEAARVEREKMAEFDRAWKAAFRERERQLKILARYGKKAVAFRARIGMLRDSASTQGRDTEA